MDANAQRLALYDTGQPDDLLLYEDVENISMNAARLPMCRLEVASLEIHRVDNAGEENEEQIMSTLKAFSLRVAVMDGEAISSCADGMHLWASLLYEDNNVVEETSVTGEPALLNRDAKVENGVASFRLRITVLSSLCCSNRFRVLVSSAEDPKLSVITDRAVKTITKLRRTPKGTSSPLAGAKHAREWDMEELEAELLSNELGESIGKRGLDDLWDEVNTNAALLLELQKQQRALFQELRELRQKTD